MSQSGKLPLYENSNFSMASNDKGEPTYDPEDFNTRAGISNQASQSSHSGSLSGSFKKPVMKEDTDNDGFQNKGYTFDEVPLESPVTATQVSFNEGKNETLKNDTNSQHGTGVQKVVSVEQEKRSIIKNLIVICIAFMLLFTAFQSMSALQSSINNVSSLSLILD